MIIAIIISQMATFLMFFSLDKNLATVFIMFLEALVNNSAKSPSNMTKIPMMSRVVLAITILVICWGSLKIVC